jgi:hypothetical protein
VLEYLPIFAQKITQIYVNIPYMEHMGTKSVETYEHVNTTRWYPPPELCLLYKPI